MQEYSVLDKEWTDLDTTFLLQILIRSPVVREDSNIHDHSQN